MLFENKIKSCRNLISNHSNVNIKKFTNISLDEILNLYLGNKQKECKKEIIKLKKHFIINNNVNIDKIAELELNIEIELKKLLKLIK